MTTYTEIKSAFDSLGLSDVPVIAHSSLSSFGEVEGGAPMVVQAFIDSFAGVIMPVHTYKTMIIPHAGPDNNALDYGVPDPLNPNPEFFTPHMPADVLMGVIPEALRQRPGAKRSSHPPSAEQQPSAAGDFYHNSDKVVSISYWAGVLSWIVLAIFTIYALSILYFNYISGAQFMSLAGLSIVLPVIIALLIGGILFVLLQGISHGLLLLLDITVDVRESVERKKPNEENLPGNHRRMAERGMS